MNLHRALRRPAAALLLVPLMAAAACSTVDGGASGAANPGAPTATDGTTGAPAERGDGAGGDVSGNDGAGPSPSVNDDGNPTTGETPAKPVTVDADAIQFSLGGTQMLCWSDADDGGEDTVFGCQANAAWPATEGDSPASVLLFTYAEDRAGGAAGEGKRDVKALQANAPVTSWEIQGVRSGSRYRLGDATIDLTGRERLTFTVPLGDSGKTASGWVSVDDYGWEK